MVGIRTVLGLGILGRVGLRLLRKRHESRSKAKPADVRSLQVHDGRSKSPPPPAGFTDHPEPNQPKPPEYERTISELLEHPRQQDVPDEARTLPTHLDQRAYEEVLERGRHEESGETPQREA